MKNFLKGLLIAAGSGAVSVVADPHAIAKDPVGSAKVAAGGAVIGVVMWLVHSPRQQNQVEKGPEKPADAL